tara:strand:+ start:6241 stop:7329 length:1089 start_codon:yes stop_codon:yes gene_type:complete
MTSAEAKLKERVKELTCLYEVTSIIVNSDYDQLEISLEAIVYCLKRAWQFEADAEAFLSVGGYTVQTSNYDPKMVALNSDIKVFNIMDGQIIVGYPAEKYAIDDFLEEEQTLLDNVSLAVGSLLERKQIRDSEATARRQMERADRLHILGEITAGIAHELNTPLANILGFAELLKEKVKNDENVRDLKKIMDNAIFSREIVKKLMFFACEMPQEMDVVQLNPIVENVLKLLKPSLREKKIKLTKSFSNENIELRADTVQLTQVLFNLIMNAVYYSPADGQIDVNISEKAKKIEIRISDEGKGIDPENVDKVFEPFFTTKPIGEGSGLGLSVVHGIIDSHKGAISHRPNSPKGTIFTIDFPKL